MMSKITLLTELHSKARESTTEQSLGGMQQNWLVGLTVAPMKLATSGQGSPRNPHDHWWLVGFGR